MTYEKHLRRKIHNFLNSNEKILDLRYDTKKTKTLNPSGVYQRLKWSNPLWFLCKLCIMGLCTILPPWGIKNMLYRITGMHIGKDVAIAAGSFFDLGHPQLITIDDGAVIGIGARVLTHDFTARHLRIGRVHIGKQATIGVRAIVRAGTTVGNNAVVAMGSYVNKDVKDGEVVAGVPIKRLKMIRN